MTPEDKDAYVQYRLSRAEQSLQEAEDLLGLGTPLLPLIVSTMLVFTLLMGCFISTGLVAQLPTVEQDECWDYTLQKAVS